MLDYNPVIGDNGSMFIEVDENPNCQMLDMMVFQEVEKARPIQGLRLEREGKRVMADVVAMNSAGEFTQAYAQKVLDSAAGHSYLIFGGDWGLRFRPQNYNNEAWDLANSHQWGESYLLYSEEDGLLFSS